MHAIFFKTMTVVLLLRFRVTLGMWSTEIITQNVKASEIPLVALNLRFDWSIQLALNTISKWGVIRSSMR